MRRDSGQALAGAAVALLGLFMAWGALKIPSDAGYSGVGPNFLPWVVSAVLVLCGGLLVLQALRGGWSDVEPPSGAERGDWSAVSWMVAGVLANAALITTIGFVLSCALCYALAVRGLRLSEGKARKGLQALPQGLLDLAVGLLIAAPVFWIFTKLLSISLPGLTGNGWI